MPKKGGAFIIGTPDKPMLAGVGGKDKVIALYGNKRAEFLKAAADTFRQCSETLAKKSADYASASDPFKTFKAVRNLGISVEQGILVRMSDKLTRVGNLVNREAAVADETVTDTLDDLINYAAILKEWLQNKKKYD